MKTLFRRNMQYLQGFVKKSGTVLQEKPQKPVALEGKAAGT
jgi:hypothetical protein